MWIEWVPSECNPADILSREGDSLFETSTGKIDQLALPTWVDMSGGRNISEILDRVSCLELPLQPAGDSVSTTDPRTKKTERPRPRPRPIDVSCADGSQMEDKIGQMSTTRSNRLFAL